jgi:hypothetical protein
VRDRGPVPFESRIPLEDHLNELAAGRCARGIADAAGDRLQANIKHLTPIGNPLDPNRSAGRPPGTARESVERSAVEDFIGPGGRGYRVLALTRDPIFPYIEWNTRPHIIRPRLDRAPATTIATRRPRRLGNDPQAAVTWIGRGGRRVFAHEVHHPGTRGVHPFSRGSLELLGQLDGVARDPLQAFERELVRRAA